ncbi:MAG: single-stranded DNA-binding protein [Clostridiales bacterium]|nr:single-stranded DNA-binding protein [Clostridiales bacterium]
MNDVTLIGHLATDPELISIQSGRGKCTFRLATEREYIDSHTGKREADFHNIVVWGQLASLCTRFLNKGRQCAVKGSIQYRSYNAQDGSKRYITEILANKVFFLGAKKSSEAVPPPTENDMPYGYSEMNNCEVPF